MTLSRSNAVKSQNVGGKAAESLITLESVVRTEFFLSLGRSKDVSALTHEKNPLFVRNALFISLGRNRCSLRSSRTIRLY